MCVEKYKSKYGRLKKKRTPKNNGKLLGNNPCVIRRNKMKENIRKVKRYRESN